MNRKDEQLDRAYSSVTCLQVARHFGIEGLNIGVQKSPFREDKHGQSFSIIPPDGRFYKDHATMDKAAGIWKFAQCCCERNGISMSGREIRDLLVTLNGEEPKKLTRGQVKREVKEKRQNLYKQAKASAEELPRFSQGEEPGVWSVPVRERWEAGLDALCEKASKRADERGWDERVVLDLIDLNKTSMVTPPWDRGRSWAWLVEKPIYKAGQISLVPVGYHERDIFYKGEQQSKRWTYVPYIPSRKRPDGSPKKLTEFQRHLAAMQTKLIAYPFVLGDFSAPPALCVTLEGQFDAVSFAEAFGWIRNGLPPGVFVFGLRGVQSQKAMLAAYGMWLRKYNPFVWIIGDNDEAGHKIDRKKDLNAIAGEPSFIDRIRAQGCPVHGELINHPGCKDFNDVYRAARPSIETMKKWAAHVGAGEFV